MEVWHTGGEAGGLFSATATVKAGHPINLTGTVALFHVEHRTTKSAKPESTRSLLKAPTFHVEHRPH